MKWIAILCIGLLPFCSLHAQKGHSSKKKPHGQARIIRPERSVRVTDSAGANDNVRGSGMTTAKDVPADKLDRNPEPTTASRNREGLPQVKQP